MVRSREAASAFTGYGLNPLQLFSRKLRGSEDFQEALVPVDDRELREYTNLEIAELFWIDVVGYFRVAGRLAVSAA